ncbi:hypothetical protein B1202_14370 [Acinetobacter amyesii]|uniref:Uncharacterized protein n=1 Tax=Acinetobacter amyesii TaxID=2942470 RepID=A0A1T1GS14_9GAMM|nr:hypothetical protein B1202_14370 [Acinetobacter amyesii]
MGWRSVIKKTRLKRTRWKNEMENGEEIPKAVRNTMKKTAFQDARNISINCGLGHGLASVAYSKSG